jgi:hypothetical protein
MMRFDQLNIRDAIAAIVIGIALLASGGTYREVLARQLAIAPPPSAPAAPATPPPVVADPVAPTPLASSPPHAAIAKPTKLAKPTKPTRSAQAIEAARGGTAAATGVASAGNRAWQEAEDEYAGGNFEAALRKAEEAIALGAVAARRIAAMASCKLGQRDKALRHAKSLRGPALAQFRAACANAASPPDEAHLEPAPDAAPTSNDLEVP